jgi:spore germination protein YaaH
VGSTGESIEWRQAVKRAKMYNAEVQRDASSGEAWYTYDDGRHTVYFNDAETLAGRLDMMLTKHPDIAGVSIWRLGGEDPANWPTLTENLKGN